VILRPDVAEELESRQTVAGGMLDHEHHLPGITLPFDRHHPNAAAATDVDRSPRAMAHSWRRGSGWRGSQREGLQDREDVWGLPGRAPPGVADATAEERMASGRPLQRPPEALQVEGPLDRAEEEKTHRKPRSLIPQQELLERRERAERGHENTLSTAGERRKSAQKR